MPSRETADRAGKEAATMIRGKSSSASEWVGSAVVVEGKVYSNSCKNLSLHLPESVAPQKW